MPVEAPKESPTRRDDGSSQTQIEIAEAETAETDLIGVPFVPFVGNQVIHLPLSSINHFDPLGGRQILQEIPRIPKYKTIYPPDYVMIESKDDEYGGDWVPDSIETSAKSNNSDEEYPHDPDGFDIYGGDRSKKIRDK
jgi:hypothetical protein